MKPIILVRLFCFVSVLIIPGCFQSDSIIQIYADSEFIQYTGRINFSDPSVPEIYWPGSQVEMKFSGEELKVQLKDEKGENYFNIVIDNDSIRYIKLDSVLRYYTLVKGLPEGEHTIQLIKRTEWDKGKTQVFGFELTNGKLLDPDPGSGRVIEFFGNSITAGYAIEDLSGGDSPDSILSNNYNTYAAITARHFDADYYATVFSGIGIMVSWFPLIMPELYDRLDPTVPESKWDFTKVRPDIVVVNLLQNDSWLVHMHDHSSFIQRFGSEAPDDDQITTAYANFISDLRKVYPDTQIICALGSMDATQKESKWPGIVEGAVKSLNDDKLFFLFFDYIDKPGHPRVSDNKLMSQRLIEFIEDNIDW